MNYEWLAVAMFVGFFFIMMSGYPVAFSFAGSAILFGAIGLGVDAFELNLLRLLPNRWFGTMSDFTLLAIPYFIFLGAILEKSGLAEELLETLGIVFGPIRGGMAIAVIIVGTLLAATTGVVAATVIMMGMMSLPIMLRYGYDKRLASGVIVASGTLAQLIPPSLVLIVLSQQIGVSVGDLFIGSFIPGLMLGSFLYPLRDRHCDLPAQSSPSLPARGAHHSWSCTGRARGKGGDPPSRADLPGVGQHLLRYRHANRSRRGR